MSALIEIKNLTKSFTSSQNTVTVLKNVNLSINSGEIYGIIGLSGAGKSTLIRCMNFLEVPTGGQVIFDGNDLGQMTEKELRKARQSMGMIFQQFQLLAQRNVLQNVCFPLELQGKDKKKREEKARELLKIVDLADKEKAYPSQLSGGQKQRVAIARALATEPKVILCDEATSALDPNTTKSILALLKDLNRKMGITVVVITHEMDVISSICDNVAIIDKGDIVERGPVKEIFESPKSHIGKQLIMGDAIKETDFSGGRYFRITFDGREAGEPVISNLVLRTKVPVNIMYAQTKAIGNKAVGEMVIQFSENEENVDSALNYLKTVNIPFEEVTENDF
ncbi:MAG: methionine ABC transporter ATP-binding protein [Muribaculaceae bacterium]